MLFKRYNGEEGAFVSTQQYFKNPDCTVCGKPNVVMTVPASLTLQGVFDMLGDHKVFMPCFVEICFVEKSFCVSEISVQSAGSHWTKGTVVSEENDFLDWFRFSKTQIRYVRSPKQLEASLRKNLDLPLSEIIKSGEQIQFTDATLNSVALPITFTLEQEK